MAFNTERVKLKSVCEIKYGKDHKKLADGSVPAYGSGGLMRYVDKSIHDKKSVLIPRKGTLSNLFLVEPPFWTVDTLFWTDIDTQKINPDFLYYQLCTMDLASRNVGTAVPSLTTALLNALEIMLPSMEVQEKIVSVLSAMDAKIRVNSKINDNLEQQAFSIYREWFVDYAPFGGSVPADWEITTLGSVASCLLGGTPSRNKAEYWGGNIPWINSGSVNLFRITKPSELITELGLNHSATKLLPVKTTVLAITGATLGQVSLLEIDACANQSVVGVVPNAVLPYEFIYPFIIANIKELISHQTGGAQQHINKQNVENLRICMPDAASMKKYRDSVGGMYSMIANNCHENERLISLRDALLPKLLSGEIDVLDINV